MRRYIIACVMFLLFVTTGYAEQKNILRNGSFEDGLNQKGIPQFWGDVPYAQTLVTPGYSGTSALKIERDRFGNAIGAQIVALDLQDGATLVVFGMVKGKDIVRQGKKWQGAKLQVMFFDAQGGQIGEALDTERYSGTFDWEMFIRDFSVPQGAKSVKVLIGLWAAKGTVWFDDLGMFQVRKKVEPFADKNNLLSDGDFESWGKWEFLGDGSIQVKYPGAKDSSQALYVNNAMPQWTFAMQNVPLKKLRTKVLVLTGKIKYTEIKPGIEAWEKGRIYAAFKDKKGKMIGSWLELLSVDGSSDWASFSKDIPVPSGATDIALYFGLQKATGEVVFDELLLTESEQKK